jgi:ribosomal protein S18 acetylase RimI-like enzyme
MTVAARVPVKVGEAVRGDRSDVERIVRATGLFRDGEAGIAVELFDEALAGEDDYQLLVTRDEQNRLTAFACWGPTPATKGTWDLYWIVVDPALHGRGVGTHLLEAVETRIHQGGGRMLLVETSSRPEYRATRAFYGKRGFALTARIPEYYAPGDDLIVFTKPVASTEGGV